MTGATTDRPTPRSRPAGAAGTGGAQLIRPCIWYDGKAEEAAALYTGLIPGSRILDVSRYPEEGQDLHGQPAGQAMLVETELAGFRLSALNGGPEFKITPAISLFVQLGSEREVDALWHGLAEGGGVLMPLDRYAWSDRYGWLVDRFGLTWQIALDPDRAAPDIALSLLFTGAQHGNSEPALEFYTSVFPGSRVEGILRHDGSGGEVAGTVKHAQFYLGGQTFMVMESALGHGFGFSEAVSFIVSCRTQEEVDRYWSALTAGGGAEGVCGWLKDRFGVSWQVVPEAVVRLVASPDKAAAGRAMRALHGMRKLDIAALEAAHAGRAQA
jgi:predicted 3-demethylubiquinone-9 3-methyltransferase (glyoxalase superfamily)